MRAPVAGLFGEPDAIIRQDGMNPTGDDVQKIFGKFQGHSSADLVHRLRYRKFAGAVYAEERLRSSLRQSRTEPLNAALCDLSSDHRQSDASATSPPFSD